MIITVATGTNAPMATPSAHQMRSFYCRTHMESFFGSLKCESEVLAQPRSPEDIRLGLFDYIEGFYNTQRIHTGLDGNSPRQFARLSRAAAGGGLLTPPAAAQVLGPFSMEP